MILGSILQATSFGRIQLIIARVITGFGNGLNTATIPMWQAETLPAYTRGAFMNLQAAYIPKTPRLITAISLRGQHYLIGFVLDFHTWNPLSNGDFH